MIASGLVDNGATVVICGRAERDVAATVQALGGGKGKCYGIAANLQEEAECRKVAEYAREVGGGMLHLLVNNAGCTWGDSFASYPSKAWDKLIGLNLRAVFHMTRAAMPLLLEGATAECPGRVVNIGSIDGIRISPVSHYAYSTSKAAVHQLTKVLASEFASRHVTINALACGLFETKMTKGIIDMAGGKEGLEAGIPLERSGSAQDIVGAVIYLASAAGAWITGAILPVDGGMLIKAQI